MGKKLKGFLLIIFFYFFILLVGSFFWIFNITTMAAVLPLGVLASSITLGVYNNIKFKSKIIPGFIWNLVFLTAVTGVCVLASVLIFDNSYDGQTYHYETQAAIVEGWNPVKQALTTGTPNIFFINHYAKGYESAAAFFWALFNNPESGKTLNILLLIACFLYIGYFLEKLKIYKQKFWLLFVAGIIALNPVAVYQLFTFYVDGQIASLITILIAALYISMKKKSSLHLVIAVVAFCIMSDIKFTGFVYAVVIFGFFGLWMVLKKKNILRFFLAGITAASVTFFVIGYNPYVTNSVQQSNPFYPLVGKNKIDIITPVQPSSFANKNALQKFFGSNFSQSHNIHGHAVTPEPVIKIPFTFSLNEWLVFKGSECRIAGYGPMFGGILLISFLLLLSALIIKKQAIVKEDAFIISLLVFLTLIINPEMWMSRYVPQLWLFPFCIIWIFRKMPDQQIFKNTGSFLVLMLTINITGIALVNWSIAGLISYKMRKEIAWIKSLGKPVKMIVNDFIAAEKRMKLYGIAVNEIRPGNSSPVLPENDYQLQNSQAKIILPPGTVKFKNTGILKLLDKKLE